MACNYAERSGFEFPSPAVSSHKMTLISALCTRVLGSRCFSAPREPLQLVAVDVVFKHGLVHVVTHHQAEGTNSVALLVLLQFHLGDKREGLLAVTAHHQL